MEVAESDLPVIAVADLQDDASVTTAHKEAIMEMTDGKEYTLEDWKEDGEIPHDYMPDPRNKFYGPTILEIFKKEYYERQYGIFRRPKIATKLMKFLVAMAQICVVIHVSLFYQVYQDIK